jgi:hypothetical protein
MEDVEDMIREGGVALLLKWALIPFFSKPLVKLTITELGLFFYMPIKSIPKKAEDIVERLFTS